jgi:hypothetical protein
MAIKRTCKINKVGLFQLYCGTDYEIPTLHILNDYCKINDILEDIYHGCFTVLSKRGKISMIHQSSKDCILLTTIRGQQIIKRIKK